MLQKAFLILYFAFSIPTIGFSQQKVQKTNNMKVYMHYMPWFETPETIGKWGWHWTMNSKNPNIIEYNKRQIAAHFYPLIGPYASRDKDVIEYHMLLMKLSGIDGVLINWYGIEGSNEDLNDLLASSNAIVEQISKYGIGFGVIMEDRFSKTVEDVKANMKYLKENYFTHPQYLKYGKANEPLVGIFGPITVEKPEQWNEIFSEVDPKMKFLTLWYESEQVGKNASGEYMWVYQDKNSHIGHLNKFYNNRAENLETTMGAAYPGFVDYYKEGKSGDGYFKIPHYEGATLDSTLNLALANKDKIDMLQLVTFNDFGEGTIFEPTLETGFTYLNKIQKFTGVDYNVDDLKLVYKLYTFRKAYINDLKVQSKLDEISKCIADLKLKEAENLFNQILMSLDQ